MLSGSEISKTLRSAIVRGAILVAVGFALVFAVGYFFGRGPHG
jgi:hypothetical protein